LKRLKVLRNGIDEYRLTTIFLSAQVASTRIDVKNCINAHCHKTYKAFSRRLHTPPVWGPDP
jgi:hypothetical protein